MVVKEELPVLFSVPHDKLVVRVGNHHEYPYFPSHWDDSEIEDWIWRNADRKDRRVLRREVTVVHRKGA